MQYTTALDGCRSIIINATTNQKQAAATEGSMEGRCDEQEVRGKHNTIVLGGVRVEEVKTKIKLLSLLIIFFLNQ